MKHTKTIALLLVVSLLLCLCCSACAKTPEAQPSEEAQEAIAPVSDPANPTDEPAATEAPATEPAEDLPTRWLYNCSEPQTIPSLPDMSYERPDTDALIAALDALIEDAKTSNNYFDLMDRYQEITLLVRHFNTMSSLACFRNYQNVNDSYYADESKYCSEQGNIISSKYTDLFSAFALSPCRWDLEKNYFGLGFFRAYEDNNPDPEEYLKLLTQETALCNQYYDIVGSDSHDTDAFLADNYEELAPLFIELVKIRQQLAVERGYENYLDYCYTNSNHRDYTPDKAQEFLNEVRSALAPLANALPEADGALSYEDGMLALNEEVLDRLSGSAEQMGGVIWDAFRFMKAYHLYDISESPNKFYSCYTTYLYEYEAPVIFVNPEYKNEAFLNFSHEFGHFVDNYASYGMYDKSNSSLDISEVFSQAMPFLAVSYDSTLSPELRSAALGYILRDLLIGSVLRQCAYADFEMQVYALEPSELTTEKLDALYIQSMRDFGLLGDELTPEDAMRWIKPRHFFLYPGYVISYATSALASMQICRLEYEEPGAGVEGFCRMLDCRSNGTLSKMLAAAGFDDSFSETTLQDTADFIRSFFALS